MPPELARQWGQAHDELEFLLLHEAIEVVRFHIQGRHQFLRRRYVWKEKAKLASDLISMALPTVRSLGEVVVRLLDIQRTAEFRTDGNAVGGVVDEDTLLPVRVATWRRFGSLAPREIPGQRSLPTPSRLLPSGWLWWGVYVGELEPDYLREGLEEAAVEYEREYGRRLGRAAVPFADWKRARLGAAPSPAPVSGGGWHAGSAPKPQWRNQRRNIARKRAAWGRHPQLFRGPAHGVGPRATGPAMVGPARPAAPR